MRKISAEERQMHALKAKMGKYKKGSKEHTAALRKMAALKRRMAAKVRHAKAHGMAKEKRMMNGKLHRDDKKVASLRARMARMKNKDGEGYKELKSKLHRETSKARGA